MKFITFLISVLFIYSYSKVSFSDTLERIVQRGSLRVCALADRLPFSSKKGNPKGIQIELAEKI